MSIFYRCSHPINCKETLTLKDFATQDPRVREIQGFIESSSAESPFLFIKLRAYEMFQELQLPYQNWGTFLTSLFQAPKTVEEIRRNLGFLYEWDRFYLSLKISDDLMVDWLSIRSGSPMALKDRLMKMTSPDERLRFSIQKISDKLWALECVLNETFGTLVYHEDLAQILLAIDQEFPGINFCLAPDDLERLCATPLPLLVSYMNYIQKGKRLGTLGRSVANEFDEGLTLDDDLVDWLLRVFPVDSLEFDWFVHLLTGKPIDMFFAQLHAEQLKASA